MAYVVRNGHQTFMGRKDGEALGIITINLEGYKPIPRIDDKRPLTGTTSKEPLQGKHRL